MNCVGVLKSKTGGSEKVSMPEGQKICSSKRAFAKVRSPFGYPSRRQSSVARERSGCSSDPADLGAGAEHFPPELSQQSTQSVIFLVLAGPGGGPSRDCPGGTGPQASSVDLLTHM